MRRIDKTLVAIGGPKRPSIRLIDRQKRFSNGALTILKAQEHMEAEPTSSSGYQRLNGVVNKKRKSRSESFCNVTIT